MKIVANLKDLDYGPDYDTQYVAAGKYFIEYETGFVGCAGYAFVELTEPWPVRTFDQTVWDSAVDHAAMYGTEPGPPPDEDESEDCEYDAYSDDIEGTATNYDPEKHDGYTLGGTPRFIQW